MLKDSFRGRHETHHNTQSVHVLHRPQVIRQYLISGSAGTEYDSWAANMGKAGSCSPRQPGQDLSKGTIHRQPHISQIRQTTITQYENTHSTHTHICLHFYEGIYIEWYYKEKYKKGEGERGRAKRG